jgi:hypothetical protein
MADVDDTLAEWSTTPGSNKPTGATTIGTGLDENLREIQAVVRAGLATKGADIASATTTDIGAIAGLMHDITGTTTITGLGTISAGIWKMLKFEGALTLTHNSTSLILLTSANRTTVAGDVGIYISEGSGNWRELVYMPVNVQLTGQGVKFPASQAASSDANTLDDYEEGTWTPALRFGGAAVGLTYSSRPASYTKIGNRVFVNGYFALTAKGSSTGTATIDDLPFAASATANKFQTLTVRAATLSSISGHLQGYVSPSGTAVNLEQLATGTAAVLTHANFNDTSDFMVSGHYEV